VDLQWLAILDLVLKVSFRIFAILVKAVIHFSRRRIISGNRMPIDATEGFIADLFAC